MTTVAPHPRRRHRCGLRAARRRGASIGRGSHSAQRARVSTPAKGMRRGATGDAHDDSLVSPAVPAPRRFPPGFALALRACGVTLDARVAPARRDRATGPTYGRGRTRARVVPQSSGHRERAASPRAGSGSNWRPLITSRATTAWRSTSCARRSRSIPRTRPAYGVLGLVYRDLGDLARAEEQLPAWRCGWPAAIRDLNNNYGWFLCQTGRERESIDYFLRALQGSALRDAGQAAAQRRHLLAPDRRRGGGGGLLPARVPESTRATRWRCTTWPRCT